MYNHAWLEYTYLISPARMRVPETKEATMRDRAEIINRIKSCIALADRPGTSDEGTAARAMADKLIAKYDIKSSELVTDMWAGVKVSYGRPNAGRQQRTWTASRTEVFSENNYYMPGKNALIKECAAAVGIKYVSTYGSTGEQSVTVGGTWAHLTDDLLRKYNAVIKLATSGMPKDIKRVKSAHSSYLMGYAAGMTEARTGNRVWTDSKVKNYEAFQAGRAAARP